ncbi:MAG: hypothetical protein IPH84_05730 [Bacteroidales bacterium]|nr:hypothetical protein [Bacteroidales bacterium]
MFTVIGAGILFGLVSLFNLSSISKEFIILFSILNQLSIFSSYIAVNQHYMRQRRKGHNLTNIIIIAGDDNESFINRIIDHPEWGYKIVMIISESHRIHDAFSSSIKMFKKTNNLSNIIKSEIVDEVFIANQTSLKMKYKT